MAEVSPEQGGRGVLVVWHRRALLREGLVLALLRRNIVGHAVAAPHPGVLHELCVAQHAESCVIDLDDQSDEQWDALGRLGAVAGIRLVGIHRSMSLATAERALGVGVRSVVGLHEGLDGLIRALRPDRWRTSSFAAQEPPGPILDDRELAVLRLIGQGLTAGAAAKLLHLTPSQVDGTKQKVFAKLGVQHQSEAIAIALRHGLLAERDQ